MTNSVNACGNRPCFPREKTTSITPRSVYLSYVQPHQHPFGAGQVSNDLSDRWRKFSYQRGYRDYLVAARQLRILQKVNYLDLIAALQMFFAQGLEVG